MAGFKDCEGRLWDVRVTVDTIKRVRSLVDVDLLSIVKGKFIEELIGDPVKLCDVIFAVCKPEADSCGVTDEDFGRAMAGDSIAHATTALLAGIVDFFQNSRDRAALRQVLAATETAMEKSRNLREKRLDSGVLEKVIDKALATAEKETDDAVAKLLADAGKSSGSAPESSG